MAASTSRDIPAEPGGSLDYVIPWQTLCFDPTAVGGDVDLAATDLAATELALSIALFVEGTHLFAYDDVRIE